MHKTELSKTLSPWAPTVITSKTNVSESNDILYNEYVMFEVWVLCIPRHPVCRVCIKSSMFTDRLFPVFPSSDSGSSQKYVRYSQNTVFVDLESMESAVLAFSLGSLCAAGTLESKNSTLLGIVEGRGWTVLSNESDTTGPRVLMAVFIAAKLVERFFLFAKNVIVFCFTALESWNFSANKTWWSSGLAILQESLLPFAEPVIGSWQTYLSYPALLVLQGNKSDF